MSSLLRMAPPRMRVVDAQGYITREWYLFLLGLFRRTGGSDPVDVTDTLIGIEAPAATMADVQALAAAAAEQLDQIPAATWPHADPEDPQHPSIEQLRAELAELRAAVAALQQSLPSS